MFKIKDIKKTDDGGVEIDFDYDEEFANQIKAGYGWKRITKSRLEWFINNALLKYADEKNKPT